MSCLLVVEDDKDSAEVLCAFLRKAGHEVVSVPNGKEALNSILYHSPDLIILDLLMPSMDGASLLEVLRSYLRLQSLPVVVFTGVADSPLADRARRLKVDKVLAKGKATMQDVIDAVEEALKNSAGAHAHSGHSSELPCEDRTAPPRN